jgi:3-oxoacyl-[acyl-carrier protein] reductase
MARNPERLESVIRELDDETGQKHEMIVADFDEPAQVKIGVDQFVSNKKTADILINNSGGPPGGTALDANITEYIDAFNRHLICNQILTQALVPGMKKKKYGRIINIISTSVKQPIVGLGVSNTVRGAVASAVVAAFLATPAASYINGINLPVDGGRTACL